METASESTNILSIINIALSSAVALIVGGLAFWLVNVQKERLGAKDDRIKGLEGDVKSTRDTNEDRVKGLEDQMRAARDINEIRVKGLEDQLRAAKDINEGRVKFANEQTEATQRRLSEALEARGLESEMEPSVVTGLDSESRQLLTALLDRLEGLEQFAPPKESADSHLLKGNAHRGAGENERAIKEYTEAIRLNPRNARAYLFRGMSLGRTGKYDHAINDYDEAIRINPGFANAYTNRAHIYNRIGDYTKAFEDANASIDLNQRSAAAHVNRGIANTFLSRLVEAEADFGRAGELGSDRAGIDREIEEIRRQNEASE